MAEAVVVKTVLWAAAKVTSLSTAATIAKASAFVYKAAVAFGVSQVVRNNTKPESNGTLVALAISPDEPRRLLIGKRATGGVMVDWFARGTRSQNIYVPIYLSDGPCGAISKIWAGGREVYSTAISHEQRHAQPEFNEDGDRLWVTYHDGRDGQAADSSLRTYFPSEVSVNDTGEGCAYVLVEYQWDDENMLSPVDLTFELEGAKFYDLRKDTSAGGSGSHRLDDRTTWEFSDNPAVVLYHYLRGIYQNDVLTWGVGLSTDEVPFDRFVALANLCDETVTLSGGGTQARYAFNGFLFADHEHDVNIKKLCRAMNCEPADFMGRIGVIDRQSKTPVLTIDDDDVIESEPSSYTPKRSRSELVTAVEGRYADPTSIYNETDYPRIAEATWLTEDGGEARTVTYPLEDHETDAERAQRLAWLFGMNERRQAILTERYPRWAIELEQGDWFTRTGDKFGAGKTFEVINAAFDPSDFTVLVVAREVDPTDSAWTTNIPNPAPTPPTPNTDTLPSGKTAPSLAFSPTTIEGADGTIVPAVQITHTPVSGDTIPRDIWIQIARDDGAGGPTGELISPVLEGTSTTMTVQLPLVSTDYVGRGKFVRGERRSNWSNWIQFTTNEDIALPTSLLDGITVDVQEDIDTLAEIILSTQIRLEEVRQNLGELARLGDKSLAKVIARIENLVEENGTAIASLAEVVATGNEELNALIVTEREARISADEAAAAVRSLLSSQIEGNAAAITSEIATRTTAIAALTALLSEISATVDDNSARITREESARATADSALASLIDGLEASVSDLESETKGFATAIQSLRTAVDQNTNKLSVNSLAITAIESSLETLEGDTLANAKAITSLRTRVVNNEGNIASLSRLVTTVSASVGSVSAAVTILQQAFADSEGNATGLFALKYTGSGSKYRFEAIAGTNIPSSIEIEADQIKLSGAVMIDGSLTTNKVANGAITDRRYYTGSDKSLPATGAHRLLFQRTIPSTGKLVEFSFDFDLNITANTEAGVHLEFWVGNSIVRRTHHRVKGPFIETLSAVARYYGSGSGDAIRVYASIDNAGRGVSGVTVTNIEARTVELKR